MAVVDRIAVKGLGVTVIPCRVPFSFACQGEGVFSLGSSCAAAGTPRGRDQDCDSSNRDAVSSAVATPGPGADPASKEARSTVAVADHAVADHVVVAMEHGRPAVPCFASRRSVVAPIVSSHRAAAGPGVSSLRVAVAPGIALPAQPHGEFRPTRAASRDGRDLGQPM
jgi:hypothetical protein